MKQFSLVLVVVFKTSRHHPEHGVGIRKVGELNIIPLENFDKRFSHAVALRTFDQGGAHDHTHDLGEFPAFRGAAGAIIRKSFDRMKKTLRSSEAIRQRLDHQVPGQGTRDPSCGSNVTRKLPDHSSPGQRPHGRSSCWDRGSNSSEHNLWLERGVLSIPSWVIGTLGPECLGRRSRCRFMIRYTCFWFTEAFPSRIRVRSRWIR